MYYITNIDKRVIAVDNEFLDLLKVNTIEELSLKIISNKIILDDSNDKVTIKTEYKDIILNKKIYPLISILGEVTLIELEKNIKPEDIKSEEIEDKKIVKSLLNEETMTIGGGNASTTSRDAEHIKNMSNIDNLLASITPLDINDSKETSDIEMIEKPIERVIKKKKVEENPLFEDDNLFGDEEEIEAPKAPEPKIEEEEEDDDLLFEDDDLFGDEEEIEAPKAPEPKVEEEEEDDDLLFEDDDLFGDEEEIEVPEAPEPKIEEEEEDDLLFEDDDLFDDEEEIEAPKASEPKIEEEEEDDLLFEDDDLFDDEEEIEAPKASEPKIEEEEEDDDLLFEDDDLFGDEEEIEALEAPEPKVEEEEYDDFLSAPPKETAVEVAKIEEEEYDDFLSVSPKEIKKEVAQKVEEEEEYDDFLSVAPKETKKEIIKEEEEEYDDFLDIPAEGSKKVIKETKIEEDKVYDKDLSRPKKPIQIELDTSTEPIVIDLKDASGRLGVTEDDFIDFLNEFIDKSIELEESIESSDSKRKDKSISDLLGLSQMLHLPTTDILKAIQESDDDEQEDLYIENFYSMLDRITTTEEEEPTKIVVPKEEEEEYEEELEEEEEEYEEELEEEEEEYEEELEEEEEEYEEELEEEEEEYEEELEEEEEEYEEELEEEEEEYEEELEEEEEEYEEELEEEEEYEEEVSADALCPPIDYDSIKPIHFDFQLEAAADDLSLPVDLIEEFVNDFIDQAHEEQQTFIDACSAGDIDTIQKTGHKLKGVSSNLRIKPLADTLEEVQFCDTPSRFEPLLRKYWGQFLAFELFMQNKSH